MLYIIFGLKESVVFHKEALMKFGRLVLLTVAVLAIPVFAHAQDAT